MILKKSTLFVWTAHLILISSYSCSSLPSAAAGSEPAQNSTTSSPASPPPQSPAILLVLETTTTTTTVPPPTTSSEKAPSPSDNDVVRVRRQEGGGGSTAVIGTRIKRETTEADWEEAKFGAYAPPPPASRRGGNRSKRSLSLSSLLPSFRFRKFFTFSTGRQQQQHGPPEEEWQVMDDPFFASLDAPHHSEGPAIGGGHGDHGHGPEAEQLEIIEGGEPAIDPSGGSSGPQFFSQQTQTQAQTTTQQRFNVINRNFLAAENYQLSSTIQGNPLLRDNIFTSPQGVSCLDLCSGPLDPSSSGYAMLGMCTPNYCECNAPVDSFQGAGGVGGGGNSPDRQCPQEGHDLVFDPVSLTCRPASSTVLCSDLEVPALFDEHANNHVDGGSFHEVEVVDHGQPGGWETSDTSSSDGVSSGWRR